MRERIPGTGSRPLIGLTGRHRSARQIAGFPSTLGHLNVDLFLADYSDDVAAAGGLPVLLPTAADPDDYLGSLDAIVLTGGADIEPANYDATPDGAGDYEPERDRLELELAEGALEHDLPILGICRGLQILNVVVGGTLNQDVPEHARYDVDPAETVHRVTFEEHSRLRLLYGDDFEVNSLHHQTIERVGDGLAVTARAEDGTIEGVEMPGRDVVAVQWHPEMRPEREPVFDWLIKRATHRRTEG